MLPALMLLGMALLWGVMACVAQIRCVDGAWLGARAVARGEPDPVMRSAVRAAAPDGARVETVRAGALVHVRVRARTLGPGPLALPLRAEAVAFAEGPAPDTAPRPAPDAVAGGGPERDARRKAGQGAAHVEG